MKQMGFMQRVQQLSVEDLQEKLDSTRLMILQFTPLLI